VALQAFKPYNRRSAYDWTNKQTSYTRAENGMRTRRLGELGGARGTIEDPLEGADRTTKVQHSHMLADGFVKFQMEKVHGSFWVSPKARTIFPNSKKTFVVLRNHKVIFTCKKMHGKKMFL